MIDQLLDLNVHFIIVLRKIRYWAKFNLKESIASVSLYAKRLDCTIGCK